MRELKVSLTRANLLSVGQLPRQHGEAETPTSNQPPCGDQGCRLLGPAVLRTCESTSAPWVILVINVNISLVGLTLLSSMFQISSTMECHGLKDWSSLRLEFSPTSQTEGRSHRFKSPSLSALLSSSQSENRCPYREKFNLNSE